MLPAITLAVATACGPASTARLSPSGLQGHQPPILDRALFFGDPAFTAARISPDGRFVSFLKPSNTHTNVWVKQFGEPMAAARPVTTTARGKIRDYFWSRDSRYILFVAKRGEDGYHHVYAVDPSVEAVGKTGVRNIRDLTPYGDVSAQIYDLPWATPTRILVGLNDRDPEVHDLYRIDLETGDRELVFENHANVDTWVTDLDGVVLIGVRVDEQGDTELLQVDGDELNAVYRCTFEETCRPIRFHEDGRRIYLVSNRGSGVDLERLVLFDPATRSQQLIDADPERRVDFGGALFSEETNELFATMYVDDRMRIHPKSRTFARDLERLQRDLPDSELSFESTTRDGRRSIIRVTRDVDPGSTYLFDRETGNVELLYRSRPALPTEQLAAMRPIRYRAHDGLEIPAYLTLPRGIAPRNLPTVIMPHDGPWARDVWGFDRFAQYLANRGYAVLQPNFRGSRGYGKRFLRRGDRAWGTGAMQDDLTDGVRYLVATGIADSTRVGIVGRSYGGYAALAGLAYTPSVYRAGVSHAGPANLLTLLQSIPRQRTRSRKIFELRLGNADDPGDRARLMDQSPLFSAANIEAPLLLIHDATDTRLRRRDSEQLVVALRDRGRQVEYLFDRGADGESNDAEKRISLAAAVELFLARQLGGRLQEDLPENIASRIATLRVDMDGLEAAFGPGGAAATPLPEADGSVLSAETLYYRTSFDAMGQEIAMAVRRTLVPIVREGRDLWRLVDSAQMLTGAVVDTAELDRQTLMPVRRSILSGGIQLVVRHTSDSVTGTIRLADQVQPVAVWLEAPAFADGPALETVIATLPLVSGYETPLRIFDVQLQRVRPMTLAVTGVETTRCVAGTFDTFVVYLTPADGDEAGTATLRVMREEPHHVVLGSTRLPQAMGGGTSLMELTAIGGRIRAR